MAIHRGSGSKLLQRVDNLLRLSASWYICIGIAVTSIGSGYKHTIPAIGSVLDSRFLQLLHRNDVLSLGDVVDRFSGV